MKKLQKVEENKPLWKIPVIMLTAKGQIKDVEKGFGTDPEDYPAECVITNNLMHHIGVYGTQTAGVFIAMSMKNTISHNHIYYLPRAGICINDPFRGGHIIEYNDIHDTVPETNDHGTFNSVTS